MNRYDDVQLDVAQLLEEQSPRLPAHDPSARSADHLGLAGSLKARLRLYATGLVYKSGVYHRLTYSNLKLDWFYEFQDYWVNELGNRPIRPHDFYFLYSTYRQRFQSLEVPDSTSCEEHLQTWQDPRTIYLLFHNQFRIALSPLVAHRFIRYIPRGGNVCEYGCGLGPISSSLCRFYPYLNIRITCADIPTIVFHFARWKFREQRFVRMLAIDPSDEAPLDDDFDTIFCKTVLEHLPSPLPVVQHLHSRLKPGGYFIFDYIKSEGGGLDTAGALRERIQVLQYVLSNFKVIKGQVLLDGSNVGTVVCKKL